MIQLTDDLIRDAFLKTGFDEKYFPAYEEKVNLTYNELQEDDPDDDETTEKESNVFSSIRIANDYIAYYVKEIEKGHGDKWASSIADNRCEEHEFYIIEEAYNSIEDKEQREQELDIHANSLSDDPIFRDRYKSLFHDGEFYAHEKAEEYCEIYHRCIKAGKTALYAHAFAYEVNDCFNNRGTDYNEHTIDIHAEAVEQAIEHGMDEDSAYCFGRCFLEICDCESWWMTDDFLKDYHEDWQKELYLYLYCKDYRYFYKQEVPEDELNDLRRELFK